MYTNVVEFESFIFLKIFLNLLVFRKINNIKINVVHCIAYVECLVFCNMSYDVTLKVRHVGMGQERGVRHLGVRHLRGTRYLGVRLIWGVPQLAGVRQLRVTSPSRYFTGKGRLLGWVRHLWGISPNKARVRLQQDKTKLGGRETYVT